MFENKEGSRVPDATLFRVGEGEPQKVSSSELFKGRRVVVFALPGAFTPTCSTYHVPGYDALAEEFRRKGVDAVYCLSVNDPEVLAAWRDAEGAGEVEFLSDGNAEFTRKLGMDFDQSEKGRGTRSWRYSMLVDDGVITKMFVEPEKEGDPFEVSDALTMLRYLNGGEFQPKYAFVFARHGCPYCARAFELLERHGYRYDVVWIQEDFSFLGLQAVGESDRTPLIFIGGRRIGGSEELEKFLDESEAVRSAS